MGPAKSCARDKSSFASENPREARIRHRNKVPKEVKWDIFCHTFFLNTVQEPVKLSSSCPAQGARIEHRHTCRAETGVLMSSVGMNSTRKQLFPVASGVRYETCTPADCITRTDTLTHSERERERERERETRARARHFPHTLSLFPRVGKRVRLLTGV